MAAHLQYIDFCFSAESFPALGQKTKIYVLLQWELSDTRCKWVMMSRETHRLLEIHHSFTPRAWTNIHHGNITETAVLRTLWYFQRLLSRSCDILQVLPNSSLFAITLQAGLQCFSQRDRRRKEGTRSEKYTLEMERSVATVAFQEESRRSRQLGSILPLS